MMSSLDLPKMCSRTTPSGRHIFEFEGYKMVKTVKAQPYLVIVLRPGVGKEPIAYVLYGSADLGRAGKRAARLRQINRGDTKVAVVHRTALGTWEVV